jgi:hypothetical protein
MDQRSRHRPQSLPACSPFGSGMVNSSLPTGKTPVAHGARPTTLNTCRR